MFLTLLQVYYGGCVPHVSLCGRTKLTVLGRKNRMHCDTSRTIKVGNVDLQGIELIENTREALMGAIGICGPGTRLPEIGSFIE